MAVRPRRPILRYRRKSTAHLVSPHLQLSADPTAVTQYRRKSLRWRNLMKKAHVPRRYFAGSPSSPSNPERQFRLLETDSSQALQEARRSEGASAVRNPKQSRSAGHESTSDARVQYPSQLLLTGLCNIVHSAVSLFGSSSGLTLRTYRGRESE
jgi:hypothetical protein